MTSSRRFVVAGCVLIFCLAAVACKSDPFVGSWKPVASGGDDDHMRIETFDIKKDGTFTIKYKDGKRNDINGTWTKAGDKIELTGPGARGKVEASIASDGRLGITEGGGPMVYFAKG